MEPGEVDHAVAPGELRISDWLDSRRVSTASVDGTFAAVNSSRSLAHLHDQVSHLLSEFELDDLDGAAIRSGRRDLTQYISRVVYQCSTSEGSRQFDGINYLSKYGDEFQNWAIFEPAAINSTKPRVISRDDLDLIEAADRLHLLFV